jgi:hypothetical protein
MMSIGLALELPPWRSEFAKPLDKPPPICPLMNKSDLSNER